VPGGRVGLTVGDPDLRRDRGAVRTAPCSQVACRHRGRWRTRIRPLEELTWLADNRSPIANNW